MCQGIGQATFKKKMVLGDPAPSLVFTNMPGKQCKIKHTFLFTVGDQAEAYGPWTACSTFGLRKKSSAEVSLRAKPLIKWIQPSPQQLLAG